jgi:hypothetical protein
MKALRPSQYISSGMLGALAAMPIYAVILTATIPVSASLGGQSLGHFGFLDWLASLFAAAAMSVLAILMWPLSIALAFALFTLSGRLIVRRQGAFGTIFLWIVAGLLVGVSTGIAMAAELHMRMWSFGEPNGTSLLALVPAAPTGVLSMLICRRLLRDFSSVPEGYKDSFVQ